MLMIPYDRPINYQEEQMKVRWLGWAGVEIEADGAAVVIDPLADPSATFAPFGEAGARAELPLRRPHRKLAAPR